MQRPTWNSLAPILRGSQPRREDVWKVIAAHTDFSVGAVQIVLRGQRDVLDRHNGSLALATHEVHQWAVERLLKRVLKPPPGLPVSARRDGAPGDAASWLKRVWGNLARDWCKSERRRWARERALDEARPPEPAAPVVDDPWDSDALRKLDRLLARPQASGTSDVHVLVYLLHVRPDRVDRAMIERACGYVARSGSRSGAAGVVRTPDAAWAAVEAWKLRHGDQPSTSAARLGIAWALRTDDPTDPDTWRKTHPAEARTATVTIGKWTLRFARALDLPEP